MSSLGNYLRELRSARGVSLEELSRLTRVALRVLTALEADDLDALPAPVFTRGFIRAYCQVLEQSPDEALRRYEALGGAVQPPVAPVAARPALERRGPGPVAVSAVLVVVLGAALYGVAAFLRSGADAPAERSPAARVSPLPPPPPVDQAPPAADQAPQAAVGAAPATSPAPAEQGALTGPGTATGAPAARPTPPGSAPALPAAPSLAPAAPSLAPAAGIARGGPPGSSQHRLVARATQPTWVRVESGRTRLAEETIPSGGVREWQTGDRFVLTVGNAGGLTLELDGRTLPPLGAAGEVVRGLVLPAESR